MTRLFGRSGEGSATPVNLAQKLAQTRFKTLFRDGMGLVQEVATYLDGPGRVETKALTRPLANAFAAESMRLTTRLMQIASWLLVQKAINEGDLDRAQGILEKNRVQMSSQGIASQAAVFAQLPDILQDFTARSLQLQAHILRLDAQLHPVDLTPVPPAAHGVQSQMDLLRRAYASQD